jgi:MFS family permease
LLLAAVSYALLQAVVAPALPLLQRDLHTTQGTVALVFTAFLLSSAITTPILGRLADLHGRRPVLLAVLISVMVGCVVCAAARSIQVFVIGRILQGVGGAVFAVSYGVVRDQAPSGRIAGRIGLLSAMLAVGGALGLVLAGPSVALFGYHWLFALPLALTAMALLGVRAFLPSNSATAQHRLPWASALALSAVLCTVLLVISQGSAWGWASDRILLLTAAIAPLTAGWVILERRAPDPLVDAGLMRLTVVWRTNLAALFLGAGMFAVNLLVPAFLETPQRAGYGLGLDVTKAGLFMLPVSAAIFAGGLLNGRTERRFGSKAVLVGGAVTMAAGMASLALWHRADGQVLGGLVAVGAGQGFAFAAAASLLVAAVPATQTGIATAMNTNIRTIGGCLGAQLTAVILTVGVRAGSLPAEHGYVFAFAFGALVLAGCAAIAALTPAAERGVSAGSETGPAPFPDPARKFHGEPADAALAERPGRL